MALTENNIRSAECQVPFKFWVEQGVLVLQWWVCFFCVGWHFWIRKITSIFIVVDGVGLKIWSIC